MASQQDHKPTYSILYIKMELLLWLVVRLLMLCNVKLSFKYVSSAKPVESVTNSVVKVHDVLCVNSTSACLLLNLSNVLTTVPNVSSSSSIASSKVTIVCGVLATHNNMLCPIVTSAYNGLSRDTIQHSPAVSSIYPMAQGSTGEGPVGINDPLVSSGWEAIVQVEGESARFA